MLKNRQSKANFSANFAITERAKKNHYVIFFIYSFFNLHFFCILEFKIRHKNSFKKLLWAWPQTFARPKVILCYNCYTNVTTFRGCGPQGGRGAGACRLEEQVFFKKKNIIQFYVPQNFSIYLHFRPSKHKSCFVTFCNLHTRYLQILDSFQQISL